jgi:hypothetical protein
MSERVKWLVVLVQDMQQFVLARSALSFFQILVCEGMVT